MKQAGMHCHDRDRPRRRSSARLPGAACVRSSALGRDRPDRGQRRGGGVGRVRVRRRRGGRRGARDRRRGVRPTAARRRPVTDPLALAADARRGFWYGAGGIASLALSGVDTALWDLAGRRSRRADSSTSRRKAPRPIPCQRRRHVGHARSRRPAEQSADYVARGFTATKGGWGHPEAEFGLDADRDVEIVRRVREAVGPTIGVAVDVSGRAGWTVSHAIEMARDWRVRASCGSRMRFTTRTTKGCAGSEAAPMAIATGEREWTPSGYGVSSSRMGVDIVLVDPGRSEGITGMRDCRGARGQPRRPLRSALVDERDQHGRVAPGARGVGERRPARAKARSVAASGRARRHAHRATDGGSGARSPGLGITSTSRSSRRYAI